MEYTYIADNLARIRETVAAACAACAACGRREDEVTLLAVTKTVPPEAVNAAIDLGVYAIGENRVQEFLEKKPQLNLNGIRTHLIGHLQSNKVSQIVGETDMIESVDSVKLAAAVDAVSEKRGIVTPILIEINIGDETAKSGIAPEALPEFLSSLDEFRSIITVGLMAVPPVSTDEYEKRVNFSKMNCLFVDNRFHLMDNIKKQSFYKNPILSMGMSHDYREAILEGATEVRIGSALFGDRKYHTEEAK